MTVLIGKGDGLVAKRIIYVAREVDGPQLVRKSGRHRGLLGTLDDAEAYIDLPIEAGGLAE